MTILFDGRASSGATPSSYLAVEEPYPGAISVVDGPNGIGRMFQFRNKAADPYVYGDWRTELAAQHEPAGAERWYGFGLYLPSASVPDDMRNALLFQLHSVDPAPEDWGRDPPLDINLLNCTRLRVTTRYDATPISTQSPATITDSPEGDYPAHGLYDRLVPIVVHAKMTWDATGFFELYIDHFPVIQRLGPMAFNDPSGPYAKLGLGHLRHGNSGRETKILNTGLLIGDKNSSYVELTGRQPYPWSLYQRGLL